MHVIFTKANCFISPDYYYYFVIKGTTVLLLKKMLGLEPFLTSE